MMSCSIIIESIMGLLLSQISKSIKIKLNVMIELVLKGRVLISNSLFAVAVDGIPLRPLVV